MSNRLAIDVSGLPTYAFGMRSITRWGTTGFMLIEGTLFVLLVACYFYLRQLVPQWPPGAKPPDLLYGTVNLALLLVSALPNQWTKKAGERKELRKVRVGMVICLVFALASLIVRIFEFRSLNCGWDSNAYGSILWITLGFHTTHLLTDAADTAVLAVLMFTGPLEGKRFSDVTDNAIYWYFVVLLWIPLYAVIYIAPRIH